MKVTSLTSTVPVRRTSSMSGSAAPRSRRRARSATARIAVAAQPRRLTATHTFAFGNTLEALVAKVLGLKARGAPTDRPLDRRTGEGRVHARDGDYADALAKGHRVHLLASESTGAVSRGVTTLLSCLAKSVLAPDGHDSTVYGAGRASAKFFYTHHIAAISSAIVRADALLVRNAAASLAFELAYAPSPA